ncbi:MAG: hypothetical protein P1U34_10770 [Coxiellaceae bacterium]|nr:hypothetical protein [Coxiellaceae bacterium]
MNKVKHHTSKLLKGRSGRRFLVFYHSMNESANHNIWLKIILISVGFVSFVIGLALLVLPGPGLPFIILGLGAMCVASKKVAFLTDRFEVYLRKKFKRGGVKS